jgi:hypothetical protein
LRRHIGADLAALAPLTERLQRICDAERVQHVSDAIGRLQGIAQELDFVQERSRLLQEEITNYLNEATNHKL